MICRFPISRNHHMVTQKLWFKDVSRRFLVVKNMFKSDDITRSSARQLLLLPFVIVFYMLCLRSHIRGLRIHKSLGIPGHCMGIRALLLILKTPRPTLQSVCQWIHDLSYTLKNQTDIIQIWPPQTHPTLAQTQYFQYFPVVLFPKQDGPRHTSTFFSFHVSLTQW